MGIIFKKPRIVTQKTMVRPSMSRETDNTEAAGVHLSPASSGLINTGVSAAVGTSSSPITATIAPLAVGGNTTSIQAAPATLTISEVITSVAPTANIPPKA